MRAYILLRRGRRVRRGGSARQNEQGVESMELVFEEQSIDYLRRIFSGSAAQELTQELIVPDSYPDCGRIVFTGACAVMRGKECRDGGRGGNRRRARRAFVCAGGRERGAGFGVLPSVFGPLRSSGGDGADTAVCHVPGARGRCAADQFTQNSGPRERCVRSGQGSRKRARRFAR